jgi:predicted O-methyltransferase YrrM
MQKEGIDYIVDYIKKNNVKSVLEIGTAIGYSTIKMCEAHANIVSIERDETRYRKALENVELAKMSDNINLIFSDAFDVDISDKFDLILIDAAKGKNIEFIEKFKSNLKKGGVIFIDNVDFHGLVGKSDDIKSRNLRSLVRKIEKFLVYLEEQDEFVVTKVDKGDGLIILS